MRCPGCGANIWPSAETYGHILGCGAGEDATGSRETRESPWAKEVQHAILEEALETMDRDLKTEHGAGSLARALLQRLAYYSSLEPENRARYGRDRRRDSRTTLTTLRRELDAIKRRLSDLERALSNP